MNRPRIDFIVQQATADLPSVTLYFERFNKGENESEYELRICNEIGAEILLTGKAIGELVRTLYNINQLIEGEPDVQPATDR